MKYKLHILVPVLAFLILFSLYIERKQYVAGILVCEKPLGERPVQLGLNEKIAEILDRFERSLAESTAVDDLVASSVISRTGNGDVSALETLPALSQTNPQNQLAAVQLLSVCTKSAEHPACTTEIIDRAIALDGDNGAMWSLVSSLRHAQGDDYGAMLALESAVAAPDYNDYFRRGMGLVVDAFRPVDDDLIGYVYAWGISYGISLTINNYRSILPVLEMCNENVADNQRLATACMSYGRRMEQQGSSLIGSAMGSVIQISTVQGLGDMAEFQRLEEEHQRNQQERFSSEVRLAFELQQHDAQLHRYFFDQIILSGEQAAVGAVSEEARRLSSQWSYDPCPSVLLGNMYLKAADFTRWALSGV